MTCRRARRVRRAAVQGESRETLRVFSTTMMVAFARHADLCTVVETSTSISAGAETAHDALLFLQRPAAVQQPYASGQA